MLQHVISIVWNITAKRLGEGAVEHTAGLLMVVWCHVIEAVSTAATVHRVWYCFSKTGE